MRQSPRPGENRTGIERARPLAEEMVRATQEFPPSSQGTSRAIAEVRVAYARASASVGEAESSPAAADGARAAMLLDKLGERLAFERTGARLYEALLSKHQAFGTFAGGPSADDLRNILHDEYAHGDMLQQAIEGLGGDPTALTPSANLAMNVSAGLPQVLSDPRSNLLQSLEAILVAELSDNECWTALEQQARQGGHEDLGDECRQAIAHERGHLRRVRRWVAAGQGRPEPDEDDSELADEAFTFSGDSPVDAEGFVVSEEESRDAGHRPAPPSPRSKRTKSR